MQRCECKGFRTKDNGMNTAVAIFDQSLVRYIHYSPFFDDDLREDAKFNAPNGNHTYSVHGVARFH